MTASSELRKLARNAEAFARDWPADGAVIVQEAITTQLRADTGGDGAFSGARFAGTATVDTEIAPYRARIFAAGGMTVWRWLEEGTKGHEVRGKGKGRSAVVTPPAGPRRSVTVRGVRARKTWERSAPAARAEVVDNAIDTFRKLLG